MPRRKGNNSLYDDNDAYEDYYEEEYEEEEDAAGSSYTNQMWACAICTFHNENRVESCEMCGSWRDATPMSAKHDTANLSRLAKMLFAPCPQQSKLKKGISNVSVLISESPVIVPFQFDTPSPDDKILGAQKTSQKNKTLLKPATQASRALEGMSKLEIGNDHNPNPVAAEAGKEEQDKATNSGAKAEAKAPTDARQMKYKGLPLESFKPEPWMLHSTKASSKCLIHLVVVGHVDAGKSTLMGRVLYALGRVSQKQMHKNQKEANEMGKASFAYAWALDEGTEERARGVTITVAVAHFETPKLRVVLLDAPGHRDFVPNMISGAAQADAAILVVDASVGRFEAGMQDAGQTKEHAQLVRSLGVNQLIVAINKLDTLDYAEDRFVEIRELLSPFLRQCGFRDKSVFWVPVSAFDGENLVSSPTKSSFRSWYTGPSLLEAFDKFEPPPRDVAKPFRMAIAETVKTRTGGLGVGGKIEAGAVRVGSKVMVMPCRETGIVKSIDVDGQSRTIAAAGDCVDIYIQGVDATLLVPGGILCHPDYLPAVATRLELRILTLKLTMPILRGSQAVLYVHHAKEPATVVDVTSLMDAKTGQLLRRSPRCLTSNQSAIIEVSLERGLCVEEYARFRGLGRAVLRSGGSTLAVGIVTKIIDCA